MSTGTEQVMGSPGVMAFYHPDGLVPAWKWASQFAGKDGHIATLPEIIEARLNSEPGDISWERYFTTRTAEYLGRDRNGKRKIVVAHGVGPMATLDGILKVYSYEYNEYKKRERDRRGGRISKEEFYKLLDGEYGPVEIIDLDEYVQEDDYPFRWIMHSHFAWGNKLLNARLGSRAYEYISRHTQFARKWHLEQAGVTVENKYQASPYAHNVYVTHREQDHLLHGKAKTFPYPYILELDGASNCSYGWWNPDKKGNPFETYILDAEPEYAIAHLVSIGGLVNLHHDGHESLVSDISCHEWSNSVRFMAIRSGFPVKNIHKGPDLSNLLRRYWQELMEPVQGQPPFPGGLRSIMTLRKDVLFTEYQKKGHNMDTGEPEFWVRSRNPIGKPTTFITKIEGYHGFFRYDVRDVQKIAPRGANAYEVVGDPGFLSDEKGDPKHHQATVQFYRANIDFSRRLMKENALKNNYDKVMELTIKEG